MSTNAYMMFNADTVLSRHIFNSAGYIEQDSKSTRGVDHVEMSYER
jgi:hypothetical protein